MDKRLPSSLAAGGTSSIRRRSGGVDAVSQLSPTIPQSSSSCVTTARTLQNHLDNTCISPRTLAIHVEDTSATDDNKVILFHSVESHNQLHPCQKNLPQDNPYPSYSDFAFSEIPLTPRFQHHNPDDNSRQSTASTSSLPTPDFSKPSFSISHSISHLLSRHSPQNDPPHQPLLSSSPTSRTCSASPPSCTTVARPDLFSSSSGNYTRKWPKPRLNPRAIGGLTAALEDSEGLGMNKVDRWTIHKWLLLVSVITAFIYSSVGLICAVLTWFRGWEHADVMCVADGDVLVLITVAASILLFASLVGICGALLNSRPILAIYSLLLWPALIALAAVGYASYKRSAFSLDRKLNLAWSQWYNPASRLIVQDSLECCGYYNALHEAIPSKRCFPRTTLPGCKGRLYRFERHNLEMIWSTVFALVPLHLIVISVSLLCSNHVTKRFGKGITPKQYRLSGEDVKFDDDNLFSKFQEYGIISKPALSKPSAGAIFREDKAERRPLLSEQG